MRTTKKHLKESMKDTLSKHYGIIEHKELLKKCSKELIKGVQYSIMLKELGIERL